MDFDELVRRLKEVTKDLHKKRIRIEINKHPDLVEALSKRYEKLDSYAAYQVAMEGVIESPRCAKPDCNEIPFGKSERVTKYCSKKCSINDQIDELVAARQKTNLTRYGNINPMCNKTISDKVIATKRKKYNGKGNSPKACQKTAARAIEMNRKGRITLMRKYGVTNSGQIKGHGDKLRKAITRKCGAPSITETPEYRENLRQKIFKKISSTPGIELLDVIAPTLEELEDKPNKLHKYHFKCETCQKEAVISSGAFNWRMERFDIVCASCANISSGSKKELEVAEFVSEISDMVARHNRKIIAPQELDIVVEPVKLAIEFNGLYWHSEDHGKDSTYHYDKTIRAMAQGYRLIHLMEDEWDLRQKASKNRLTHALGVSERIYARHCCIEEISKAEFYDFLSEYSTGNKKKDVDVFLGIKFKDEIVGVLGVVSHSDYHEISNIDFKGSVVGGASKLLSFFKSKYNPDKIISYCNRQWGEGEVFKILGFSLEESTPPESWSLICDTRQPADTNAENKIWDCGYNKWVWKK